MVGGYFRNSWHDITSSPGWVGKICLLSLVGFIPVFGQIVLFGYLFGWARDIAWGVRGPMPARIFGNEDGKLYARGLFAWVISLVCSLLPMAVEVVWMIPAGGMALVAGWGSSSFTPFAVLGIGGMVAAVVSVVAAFAASVFWLVGSVRMSIYGRLGPGFQFGKLWAMMRRDPQGILRLVGMYLAICAVLVIAFVVIALVLVLGAIAASAFVAAIMGSRGGSWDAVAAQVALVLLVGIPAILAVAFAIEVAAVMAYALIIRAAGYWMGQFDVPAWRGPDDPLPFQVPSVYGACAVPPMPVPPAPAQAPAASAPVSAPAPSPAVAPMAAPVPAPVATPIAPAAAPVLVPESGPEAAPASAVTLTLEPEGAQPSSEAPAGSSAAPEATAPEEHPDGQR